MFEDKSIDNTQIYNDTSISTELLNDKSVVFMLGDDSTVTFNNNVTVFSYPKYEHVSYEGVKVVIDKDSVNSSEETPFMIKSTTKNKFKKYIKKYGKFLKTKFKNNIF